MKNMGLKLKLILGFLFAGLVPLLIMGIYSYSKSADTIQTQQTEKLNAVKTIKGDAVKRYFENIKLQILTFSHDLTVVSALNDFNSSFEKYSQEASLQSSDIEMLKEKLNSYYESQVAKKFKSETGTEFEYKNILNQISENQQIMQFKYIAENPNEIGKKDNYSSANENTQYNRFHAKYHPLFHEYQQKFGYYDIFLVDIKTGNVVYTVFKELDFATSVLTGPYKNSNLGEVFQKALQINNPEESVLVDYKEYTPSYGAPASFIASPIWDKGEKVGVAIFQMPIDRLNLIMNERTGMGETGETYLIGNDGLFRSDSFLDSKNHSVLASFKKSDTPASSPGISLALKQESGNQVTTNYLGNNVISSYSPIDILGLKWGLIAEIKTDEAFSSIYTLRNILILFFVIAFIVILILSYGLSNNITTKIANLTEKLSQGSQQVATSSTSISEISSELSEASTEQAASLQETVASIDEISSMVQKNADSATSSTQVSNKSNEAAKRGKNTVEQMITSIGEIADSNQEIMLEMQTNNNELTKIVNMISEIGEKTKVINDIVFQTKLLSFNASVEAARAGEHGKGFAVVAEEVGNLAAMSGKASLEISEMLENSMKQVSEIVSKTKSKVETLVGQGKSKVENGKKTAMQCGDVLEEILQNVTAVNEMVKEIATASSEQATGVREVTKAMQQFDQTTHQNTTVAQSSSHMSVQLKHQAENLNSIVNELTTIIYGGHKPPAKAINHVPNSKSNESQNIISLKKHKPKEKSEPNTQKVKVEKVEKKNLKISGTDSEVPLADDPRFEEL